MAVDPNLQRARAGLVGCAALLAGVLLAALVIWGVVRGAQFALWDDFLQTVSWLTRQSESFDLIEP